MLSSKDSVHTSTAFCHRSLSLSLFSISPRSVDGINNPNLPCPEDNAGGLPAGTVYTKYDWSLYHFENPIYGHMGIDSKTGNVFGAWWTPLSGISDTTSTGGFGVGPNRQDLAIHQDSIILGYFIPNH